MLKIKIKIRQKRFVRFFFLLQAKVEALICKIKKNRKKSGMKYSATWVNILHAFFSERVLGEHKNSN